MNYSFEHIETMLRETFTDARLSTAEKTQVVGLVTDLNEEQRRFARNRCFEIFRQNLSSTSSKQQISQATKWLERILKTLDTGVAIPAPKVYFSPGDDCRDAIINICQQARSQIDICVFTLSDNRISEQISAAFQRGIAMRIITDNDKANDDGSDIYRLAREGIAVKTDHTPNHMHHKFAVIDQQILINGSFNWTRSASERNQENVMVSYAPAAIEAYLATFEQLWKAFGKTL